MANEKPRLTCLALAHSFVGGLEIKGAIAMHPITVRVVLATPLAAALLALGACNKAAEPAAQQPETPVAVQPQESAAPGGQSSDWVKEPADMQGVKVNLPNTPMTNPPVEGAAPAK